MRQRAAPGARHNTQIGSCATIPPLLRPALPLLPVSRPPLRCERRSSGSAKRAVGRTHTAHTPPALRPNRTMHHLARTAARSATRRTASRRLPAWPLRRAALSRSAADGPAAAATTAATTATTAPAATTPAPAPTPWSDVPGIKRGRTMAIVFTCGVCDTRSAKTFSKLAYDKGVVIAKCPKCEGQHLIADRLGFFDESRGAGQGWDVAGELSARGEAVKLVASDDELLELLPADLLGGASGPGAVPTAQRAWRPAGGDAGGYALDGAAPVPAAGAGEVVVRVRAAGVNRADLLQSSGHYPPPPGAADALGLEVSGEVVAVGDGVAAAAAAVGDEVMALLDGGGWAEYAAVDAGRLMPKPETLGWADAATVPEAWCTAYVGRALLLLLHLPRVYYYHAPHARPAPTAKVLRTRLAPPRYQLLHRVAEIKPGQTVLVHAAASGVGCAAVQLAKAAGAKAVYATVGTPEKRDLALALGADACWLHTDGAEAWAAAAVAATGGAGVDVVLDCVGGGPHWRANAAALATDGAWVLYGMLGGVKADGPLFALLMQKRIRLLATTLRDRSDAYKAALVADVARDVLPALRAGDLKLVRDRTWPLAEAGKALTYLKSNLGRGKNAVSVVPEEEEPEADE